MSEANHNRSSYEYPYPTRKQVAKYVHASKTPQERAVWRNLLRGEAFHKPKTRVEGKVAKKVDKEISAKAKRK